MRRYRGCSRYRPCTPDPALRIAIRGPMIPIRAGSVEWVPADAEAAASCRVSSSPASFPAQKQGTLVAGTYPVGHVLGFLDVVRGQNDGNPLIAQASNQVPHV